MVDGTCHATNDYFEKLEVIASQWRKAVTQDASLAADKLARKGLYVRLGRDGYRVVSIRTENPCGSTGSKPVKSVEDVKTCIARNPRGTLPGNKKPEQRVQAYLIHQSLVRSPESIARMLDQGGQLVDLLWFVADEIRLGGENIRADMLFVGRKGRKAFPVLVELKANRTLGRVVEQLDDMHDAVERSRVAFCSFLRSVVPEAASDIDFESLQKWIIWPAAVGTPRSLVAEAVKDKAGTLKVIEFKDAQGSAGGKAIIKTCFDFEAKPEPLKFNVTHA